MERATNPYSPGAGLMPPYLAGRDSELRHFDEVLGAAAQGRGEQSLAYSGLRGVGKTVLLNELRRRAKEANWVALRPTESGAAGGLLNRLAPALTRETEALARRGVTGKVKHAMGVLRALSVTFKLPGVEFSVAAPPPPGYASSGVLDNDLSDVLVALGEAAQESGAGVALFVDELQDVASNDLAALIVAVHHCNQEGVPVLLVGAGLPHLPAVLSEAKSYAERLFDFRPIGKLDPTLIREALVKPAQDLGVVYDEDASKAIVSFSAGYPFFLQAAGSFTWEASAGSPISLADAQIGVGKARDSLDAGFYKSRYERATPAEKAYLQAMAGLMRGKTASVTSLAVAKAAGYKDIQGASPTRGELIRKGLIHSESRGRIAFTAPLFADYIRRRVRSLGGVPGDDLELA